MTADLRYFVQGNDHTGVRTLRAEKGDILSVRVDFTMQQDAVGIIYDAMAAEIVNGTATIAGEGHTNGVWSARIGTPQAGRSLMKVTASGSNYAKAFYLDIGVRNRELPAYGGVW